jgi:hypothetical protein
MKASVRSENNQETSREYAQKQASDAWAKFCTVARFKVGGYVKIGGHAVSIEEMRPVTGGRVYIKGYYPGGIVDGQYKPDDLDEV